MLYAILKYNIFWKGEWKNIRLLEQLIFWTCFFFNECYLELSSLLEITKELNNVFMFASLNNPELILGSVSYVSSCMAFVSSGEGL